MAEHKGFLKTARRESQCRAVCERVLDFKDVSKLPLEAESQEQASRCMDCGTPFCNWACPIANYIPEWNDYVFKGRWEEAFKLLDAANNLPEITGRVCPALCEYSCVLGLNNDAVTIRENELAIAEFGFKNSLLKAKKIKKRTGKRVAVVGSGPAGLSCAAELNSFGHSVTVFERDKRIGGILRYGIPDFKLEKHIIDRRIDIWAQEGIVFKAGIDVGRGYSADNILRDFDAVCLACGCRAPRDLAIEGRDLKGIYFAMDYLVQSNKRISGESIEGEDLIDAKGKRVVVIGGGDTGSDCIGTAHRQKAGCVVQLEILSKPPKYRCDDLPWPLYPLLLKTSSSHREGGQRHWAVATKSFIGQGGILKKISCLRVELDRKNINPCSSIKEILGSEFEIEADMAIIAIGFLHPEHSGLLNDLGVEFDSRGNVKTNSDHATSVEKVFSAGDIRRGQSLVVWAIQEGRSCAGYIDRYLGGENSSNLYKRNIL